MNTTAEVKAELDYCCTSGNVLDVIDAIPADQGILFLPDFFLGSHVRRMRPERRIEVWMGECHVHKGIRPDVLNEARAAYPEAEVLVHPECGCAGQLIYSMGRGDIDPDGLHITSTEGMIRTVTERPAKQFIVATETGIMHRMRQVAPEKQFIPADPEAVCAFMKTITLTGVRDSLALDRYHVTVATRDRQAGPRGHRSHGGARIGARQCPPSARSSASPRLGPGRGRPARHHQRPDGVARDPGRWRHRVPQRRGAVRPRVRRCGRQPCGCTIEWTAAEGDTVQPAVAVGVARGELR